MTRAQAYFLIGKVLSLKINPQPVIEIPDLFPKTESGWQMIVKTGSDNLVLPSFYLMLQKHQLLNYLPGELSEWLSNIYLLNLERNTKAIAEAKGVNDLLRRNNLPCLFMKGVANLFDDLYDGAGERLIYDIDILTDTNEMTRAVNVLKESGYYPVKRFNQNSLTSALHYPLLVKEGAVIGVEIHRLPTQFIYMKSLSAQEALTEASGVKRHENIMVMSLRHRIIHNFIHTQLMHNGHYHANISLRDMYDLILLGQRLSLSEVFGNFPFYKRQSLAYLRLTEKVFGVETVPKSRSYSRSFLAWRQGQVLKMNISTLQVYHAVLLIMQKYFILPLRLIWNPLARNYVISRLGDKTWYGDHWRAMKKRIFNR